MNKNIFLKKKIINLSNQINKNKYFKEKAIEYVIKELKKDIKPKNKIKKINNHTKCVLFPKTTCSYNKYNFKIKKFKKKNIKILWTSWNYNTQKFSCKLGDYLSKNNTNTMAIEQSNFSLNIFKWGLWDEQFNNLYKIFNNTKLNINDNDKVYKKNIIGLYIKIMGK